MAHLLIASVRCTRQTWKSLVYSVHWLLKFWKQLILFTKFFNTNPIVNKCLVAFNKIRNGCNKMHQKKLQGTLIFKTFMACCLWTRLESPKGFWVTAIVHFNYQNNEMEAMVYLTNPAGVEIFSHVNTFVGFMLHILCCRRNLGQQNEK